MKDCFLEISGRKVHYTVDKARCADNGSGKTVVLIHGFTEAVFVWRELAEYLCCQGYDVLCPDLAGHGKSDSFASVHSMELQAQIVKEILSHESIGKAVLIGHSMGGYVAAAFASRYPESVSGIGFFHSHPGGDTEGAKSDRRRMIDLLRAGKMSFITETTADLFAPGTAERYADRIAALNASARAMGAEAIAAAQQGMLERESLLQIYGLKVPFLFIIGKEDKRADLPKLLAQTLMPEEAYVLTLPVGHMGFYERENQTKTFINGYLSGICW